MVVVVVVSNINKWLDDDNDTGNNDSCIDHKSSSDNGSGSVTEE